MIAANYYQKITNEDVVLQQNKIMQKIRMKRGCLAISNKQQKVMNIPSQRQLNQHIMRSEQTILDHELLRILVHQKQSEVKQLFAKNQKELCEYFIRYKPTPCSQIKVKNMTNEQARLIKNVNKVYFGGYQNQKRKGEGILITLGGRIYEGEFEDNLRNGFGVEIYQNKNVYIGNFVRNKKHGEGAFYWFNISPPAKPDAKFVEYYSGGWWGNYPDGKGSMQKANGNIYDGHFKNGLKHGQGEEYFFNGDSYMGDYVNGLPEGFGKYVWLDGSTYQGDFKQGLRSGHGLWYSHQHKQRYLGQFIMDKKQGYGEFTWKQGKFMYKGYFQNDLRHGFGELYINDILEYKGQWYQGERLHKVNINHRYGDRSNKSSPRKKPKEEEQQDNQNTPSNEFTLGMKLKPPSAAIIKKLQIPSDQNQTACSFVRSYQKTTQNSKALFRSHAKINRKSFGNGQNQNSSEKDNPTKNRPKSHNKRQPIRSETEPTYELLVKNCRKKNCGCNMSIPLGNSLLFREKKVRSFYLKTQQKVNNFL